MLYGAAAAAARNCRSPRSTATATGQHWCRDCFSAYFRERGARHREQSAAARRRRREAARAFIREHLAEHPCADCGEEDLLVLEFDHHRGEKDQEIARLLAGARLERLRREVERCEVVCVNCHRRRTATRAGSFRVTGVAPASWTAPQLRNHSFLVEVLRTAGCCDCGERDPVVLDFDHIGEKRAGVTRLANRSSLAVLRAEIERCMVRAPTVIASARSPMRPAGGPKTTGRWSSTAPERGLIRTRKKPENSVPPGRIELPRVGLKVRCSTS